MAIQGIHTQHGGMQAAAPSRIALKPVADRVQAHSSASDRVEQRDVTDRVEVHSNATRRVNIEA